MKRAAIMAPACQSFLDNVVAQDQRHLIAELPRRITRVRLMQFEARVKCRLAAKMK
jgi:hypothetical protein